MSADSVRAVLAPVVQAGGYDLEDVEVQPAGRRRLLRVIVDSDEGVSLDAVAELSQAISTALDDSEAMGESPYVLEVSSPGVDRPLTLPRHWRRAVGRLVRVDLADGSSVRGRLLEADEVGALVDQSGEEHRVAYTVVRRATVQVEFSRPAGDTTGAGEEA